MSDRAKGTETVKDFLYLSVHTADDAGCHAVGQVKRTAKSHDPFANSKVLGGAQRDDWQGPAVLDLQHCQI